MHASETKPRNNWVVVAGVSVVGTLLVSLLVLAFLWPAKTAQVHNIPIAVAGPEPAVAALTQTLETKAPGTFTIRAVDDKAAAESLIRHRDVYGAIVLAAPPAAPEVLTASAGSPVVAQLLTGISTQLTAQLAQQVAAAGGDASQVHVAVTDVVPLAETDHTGSGLAAASFPMTIAGMLGGILISLLVTGSARRLVALAGFSVLAGLALTSILHPWFGYLGGNFGLNALAVGLAIFATSGFIIGCATLLGRPGMGLAAAFTILFANPLASAATPIEFLPEPWGAIGQGMVPGAANHLLRSQSYFPDAGTSGQWWTLIIWAVVAVALIALGSLRTKRVANA